MNKDFQALRKLLPMVPLDGTGALVLDEDGRIALVDRENCYPAEDGGGPMPIRYLDKYESKFVLSSLSAMHERMLNGPAFDATVTTPRSLLDIAYEYAVVRWLLDDKSHVGELIEGLEPGEIIAKINEHAADCDLTDPWNDFSLSSSEIQKRRGQAEALQRELDVLQEALKTKSKVAQP